MAKRRRTQLLADASRRTNSIPLHDLNWREFEQLVGAHFESKGCAVSFTQEGADGGVDVIARKGREKFLIQCKQWRNTKVGVSVVRELFGVMNADGATGAYVVSIGDFTQDARDFARGRNIELVDANLLLATSRSENRRYSPTTPPTNTPASATTMPIPASAAFKAASPSTPSCPKCGSSMERRVAKQGANKGNAFFGCSTYPKCRGVLQMQP